MKKTKFKDRNKYKIGELIIIIMTIIFLLPPITLIILKKFFNDFNLDFLIVGTFVPAIIFGILLISILYGKIRVKKKEILIEKEIKLDNPYIYYRVLPNNFGIGISSILVNKTIENDIDLLNGRLVFTKNKFIRQEI